MSPRPCMRMSAAFLGAVLLCSLSFAGPPEVQVGQNTNEVISILGEPKGVVQSGSFQVLLYPQGEVVFRDGRATSVALLSPEEAAMKEENQRRKEFEWQQKQEEEARLAAARAAAPTPEGAMAVPAALAVPVAPGELKPPEMTEAEKRKARVEALQAEIKAAEQAEQDLGSTASSVQRRRELREELADLEKKYPSMPVTTDEEKVAKSDVAARMESIRQEIEDLGNQANRIRLRRETRERLEKLRAELKTLQ